MVFKGKLIGMPLPESAFLKMLPDLDHDLDNVISVTWTWY